MITRRAVLLGGASAALLAACSSSASIASEIRLTTGSFRSRYRRTDVGWAVLAPARRSGGALPVLIALHGRGGDHTDTYRALHLDAVLANIRQPFAIASVDGGDHSYWHPRADGDAAGMVVHEFVPLLAARGYDVRRIGLFGWSMGGYGALYLSTVLGASRVAVTVAESPAIWHHSWQSAAGAFDDATDFDRHGIFGRQHQLAGIAVRIDCGASDGFAPVTRDLRATLRPTPSGGIEPGGHDDTYWRSQAPAQLAFVGRHLTQ